MQFDFFSLFPSLDDSGVVSEKDLLRAFLLVEARLVMWSSYPAISKCISLLLRSLSLSLNFDNDITTFIIVIIIIFIL